MAFSVHKCLSWQMGSASDFFEIFATEPGAGAGVSFARFMELAMYHPQAGYYTRDFRRVGRDAKADFFTALWNVVNWADVAARFENHAAIRPTSYPAAARTARVEAASS